jgi:RNA-binding protein PNO1
MLGFDL